VAAVAAAAVIIAAAGFITLFTQGGGIAFADVVRPFITAHTATFTTTMQIEGMPAQTLEGMFMEPGYMRQTGPGGVIVVGDLRQGKTVTLMPSQKLAMVMEMVNMPEAEELGQFNMFLEIRKRIQEVQETPDESVEFLGEEQIDGRLAIGYHVSKGGGDITVWADKETKMPIRLEIATGAVTQSMSDIVFDVPLDESLFDLTIPEGYTVRTMQMDASPPTEEELVDMFGIWADYMDGSFPSTLDMKSIMKEITEFVMGLREKFKTEGREPTEEEMQELQKRIMKVSRGVTFVQLLPPESDWHYTGKGATFGDADTPIFWYRPEGSETFRVIYGDLRVEDVPPENLPILDENEESQ
jgi:outer membrane lipoprotein-sorting protein